MMVSKHLKNISESFSRIMSGLERALKQSQKIGTNEKKVESTKKTQPIGPRCHHKGCKKTKSRFCQFDSKGFHDYPENLVCGENLDQDVRNYQFDKYPSEMFKALDINHRYSPCKTCKVIIDYQYTRWSARKKGKITHEGIGPHYARKHFGLYQCFFCSNILVAKENEPVNCGCKMRTYPVRTQKDILEEDTRVPNLFDVLKKDEEEDHEEDHEEEDNEEDHEEEDREGNCKEEEDHEEDPVVLNHEEEEAYNDFFRKLSLPDLSSREQFPVLKKAEKEEEELKKEELKEFLVLAGKINDDPLYQHFTVSIFRYGYVPYIFGNNMHYYYPNDKDACHRPGIPEYYAEYMKFISFCNGIANREAYLKHFSE